MKLASLLKYETIWVQCHDNPDADALASGFAMYTYFAGAGKKVRFVYSGRNQITKSNLCLMIKKLNIPVEYVKEADEVPDLLLMVDCQYGEGNVSSFEGKKIAVIDHHQVNRKLPSLSEVRSNIGSCSTIIYDMLKKEKSDILNNKLIVTGLLYGLMTDTNHFAELSHPLDKDLRDEAVFDKSLITLFCNSNLSLEELEIAGRALSHYRYYEKSRFAVVEAKPCDPNILGIISDMLLEVDTVDTCLVYSVLPFGIKLSVRSCVKETKASELAEYITKGIGSGGGHVQKAGGFILKESFEKAYPEVHYQEVTELAKVLDGIMQAYFDESEVIYAKDYLLEEEKLSRYQKLPVELGYVKATDVFEAGKDINIRTIEGDLEMKIEEDLYIMIGILGEVYPNKEAKFLKGNTPIDKPYEFLGEYEPAIKDRVHGTNVSLIPYAKSCVATGGVKIRAMELDHRVKVFTAWDEDKYFLGKPGDYLACREDDLHDIYVIEHSIFHKTYEKI